MKKYIFLLILISLTQGVLAQDVITVTADRISSSLDASPSDIKVFKEEEIKSAESIKELLDQSSDINVSQSGPIGGNTSFFLRGADSSQTLVIIDGIIMNDPSNPNRQFDLGRLSLNNIARIEVLKGSQGLLYGSNAIGGVILITTKAGIAKDSASAHLEYGTYSTFNSAVNAQKSFEQTQLGLGIDYLNSQGFSAANDKTTPLTDNDGVERSTIDTSLIQKLGSSKVQFNYRLVNDQVDLDKSAGNGGDDPNDTQWTQQQFMKAELNHEWANSESKIYATKTKHHRTLNVLPDSLHPEESSMITKGTIDTAAANHTQYFTSTYTQFFSLDYQKEEDQQDNSNENTSIFSYARFDFDKHTVTIGGREDFNQSFGEHFTYKLAYLYQWDRASVKTSLSTGFRAPSLNQLFDPTYGNKDLQPEESLSFEIGGDISVDNFKYQVAIFQTELKNRLSYHPVTFINLNRGEARTRGIENNFNLNLYEYFSPYLSFTFLEAKDLLTNQQLARRPKFNAVFGLISKFEKNQITTSVNYVGKRNDVDSVGLPVSMGSYTVWDLAFERRIVNQLKASFKINNVLDYEYEEVFGYGTGGRLLILGMNYDY